MKLLNTSNRNMSESKGWTLQSSLLMLWKEKTQVKNQTKIAGQEKLTITHFNNQTGPNCFYTGNTSRGTQQMKCVGNTDVFCFGFNFMSPKWTRTKLIFDVTLPQRPNEVYQLYRGGTGSSDQFLKFSFQTAVFSLSMAMRILSSMFWFAISVFRTLKCEAVNFDIYSLACANGTSIRNSWHTTYN